MKEGDAMFQFQFCPQRGTEFTQIIVKEIILVWSCRRNHQFLHFCSLSLEPLLTEKQLKMPPVPNYI